MNPYTVSPERRGLSLAVTVALTVLFGGCVSYSQSQLSAMSAVDLCELQNMQGPNLSTETQQALQSELQRRNDNCRNHAVEVARRHEAFMWYETYGKLDP